MEPKRFMQEIAEEMDSAESVKRVSLDQQQKAYNNLIQTGAEWVIARAELDRMHTVYNQALAEFEVKDKGLEDARLKWMRANGRDL